jgi:hypothetical protein
MKHRHRFRYIFRQVLVGVFLIGGAVITLATSPGEPWDEVIPETSVRVISGRLFIAWPLADEDDWSQLSDEEVFENLERRNFSPGDTRDILVSTLDPNINVDCEAVLDAPLDYLNESMFVNPKLYSLFQGDLIAVDFTSRGGCQFLNVVGDQFNSTIVAISSTNTSSGNANGSGESSLPSSTIVVRDDGIEISEDPNNIHSFTSWTDRQDSDWRTCSENHQSRLAWQLPADRVDGVQLSSVKRGVDGCHELSLVDDRSMLICAPWEALSFLDQAWFVSAGENLQDRAHTLQVNFFKSMDDFEEGSAAVIIEGLRDWSDTFTFRYPLTTIEGCEPIKKACGQSSVRLAVDLDAAQLEELNRDDGHPPLRLPDLAPDKQHWLLNAEREVLSVANCEEPEAFKQPNTGYYFENFIVTYLGGE